MQIWKDFFWNDPFIMVLATYLNHVHRNLESFFIYFFRILAIEYPKNRLHICNYSSILTHVCWIINQIWNFHLDKLNIFVKIQYLFFLHRFFFDFMVEIFKIFENSIISVEASPSIDLTYY